MLTLGAFVPCAICVAAWVVIALPAHATHLTRLVVYGLYWILS